jgi:hypothetical protein
MDDGCRKNPSSCVCVVCGTVLENIGDPGFQPLRGLAFSTRGHYGSSFFDPMDATYLEIVICDECMKGDRVRPWTYRSEPELLPTVADNELTDEEWDVAHGDLLEALTGSRSRSSTG